ncbi:hypothetical protein OYT1_ch2703 [Ferriphaselus amnicola]|uniref:Uncharacterized protein n=1 Tax=Ferriphaselus amnicola TaxID=1188319 RepID=A0A2Z6GFD9_9PROT|nr:hypothetical protein [Ferriphaselus amnicola]BBE52210.1 hypothetical protein OYT1_ch2703 [Ferriphaselus amnicola]
MNRLFKVFTRNSKSSSVDIVAQRFIQAFADHGIQPAQISRFLPQIGLDSLRSNAALLSVLTPEILEHTAKLFGISLKWLEGADSKIYEYQYCYKQPEIFIEQLAAIQARMWDDDIGIPFRVLTTSKALSNASAAYQPLIPVLVEKIANVGDEPIYRYTVFNDGFDWSHPPARIQLKAMARIAFTLGTTVVPLLVVKPNVLERTLERELIPLDYLHRGLVSNPSLEDYALSEDRLIAKETEELPLVMDYIEQHDLVRLFVEAKRRLSTLDLEAKAVPEVGATVPAPPKIGKREQNKKLLWEPVVATAQALWAEHGDSLHIAEAIRRIKRMPHLPAAKLSDSAIRKHIAPHAPDEVSGKSGRKPNKST